MAEGVWRRSVAELPTRWRESAVVALVLGVLTAITSTFVEGGGGWWSPVLWFLVPVMLVALAVWLWGLLRAPFNQRDEARAAL